MEQNARSIVRRTLAAASISLVVAVPILAGATVRTSHEEEPLGTRIFNRVIQHLCDAQDVLDGRIRLADPSRCESTPPPPPPPPPPPETAMLTVKKMVVNDNGGTGSASDFTIHVHYMVDETMLDVAGSPQPGSETGTTYTIVPGQYHVAETGGPAGYTMTIGGDCAADGTVTLAVDDEKTCTVTNDDNPPTQTIGHVVISEVYYDVASTTPGSESSNEWMELYNGSNATVNLQGWFVADSAGMDEIEDVVMLDPGERALIVGSTTPQGVPAGVAVVVLRGPIGSNGFSNTGDGAELHNSSHVVIDAVGYGTNETISPTVSIPASHDGHSIMRTQVTSDTNTAADWADTATPTPGM